MPCKTGELTTASDGLPARCVGQWSKDKCYYIGRYAAIFSAGMKDKFPKRDYIDLFAGPGRCVLSDDSGEFDGSPILALNTKVPFTTYRTLTDGRRVDLIYLFPDAMDVRRNSNCI